VRWNARWGNRFHIANRISDDLPNINPFAVDRPQLIAVALAVSASPCRSKPMPISGFVVVVDIL
jgi:hypothetical protein